MIQNGATSRGVSEGVKAFTGKLGSGAALTPAPGYDLVKSCYGPYSASMRTVGNTPVASVTAAADWASSFSVSR
jgi:hypothetical protein